MEGRSSMLAPTPSIPMACMDMCVDAISRMVSNALKIWFSLTVVVLVGEWLIISLYECKCTNFRRKDAKKKPIKNDFATDIKIPDEGQKSVIWAGKIIF